MIGTEIASYRILEKLGEGGMGIVYKAVDTALDRMVAVKVLSSDLAGNPELVQRFRAEAKAQANLNHTNLATLYAFVVQDGRASMVMELVDGETFEQMILRRGPLQAPEALPLFKQALLGIGYAHRAGIVHRDIKPSNLMVNRLGIVKVMDFGIAKVMGVRGVTRTGVQMGTGWYMSPEQVLNRPVDIRSDIYSLGVTLYQMITAHVPFDGPSDYQIMTDHVHTPPPVPTRFSPYIPKGVENAILKALEKNPDARFQTVEEFGAALDHPEDFMLAPQPAIARTPASVVAPVAAAVTAAVATDVPAVPVPASSASAVQKLLVAFFASPERKVMAGAAGLAIVLLAGFLALRSRNSEAQAPLPPPVASGPSTPTPLEQQLDAAQRAADMSSRTATSTGATQQPAPAVRTSAAPHSPVTPRITFNAVATSIPQGGSTRLRWNLTNTKSARIAPGPGVLRKANGEFMVAPATTTTYTLTASSSDGTVATATTTVQVIPGPRPDVVILVHHDHGFAASGWPQCWGKLQVMGNHLQYRVIGSSDGRRDDFDVLLSQVQQVQPNRMPIRNLPAFHMIVNGQNFNFVPQGTSPAQAVAAIVHKINAR
jgi:hypothetical protein